MGRAAPVALATPDEVRAALESGRIDGALMSFEVAFPAGIIAATRIHTRPARLPGLATSLYLLAMNKVRYEGLPGDLRQLIDESAGRDLAGRVGRSWDSVERLNIKRSRGEGHVFYKLGEAETARWRIAARPVIESWTGELDAAGMDGAALLAAARAAIARYEVIREVE